MLSSPLRFLAAAAGAGMERAGTAAGIPSSGARGDRPGELVLVAEEGVCGGSSVWPGLASNTDHQPPVISVTV